MKVLLTQFIFFFIILLSLSTTGVAQELLEVITVAGNGTDGAGDGGLAVNASLGSLTHICVDQAGNLYITDGNTIRKIDVQSGIISTVAGNGRQGFSGDGGLATEASLNGSPDGIVVDENGDLYFSDSDFDNGRIRKIDALSGIVTTVSEGDDNPFANSFSPGGLFVWSDTLYVTDYNNDCIHKVDLSTGQYSEFKSIDSPMDMTIDGKGNLYIVDRDRLSVRKLNKQTGRTEIVAGTDVSGNSGDGGLATEAMFGEIGGIAVDVDGNIYVSDSRNHIIWRIDSITGLISTIAGDGFMDDSIFKLGRYLGDGGLAIEASLSSPEGIAIDSMGNIYFIDNYRFIRKIDLSTGIITTVAGGDLSGGDGDLATSASISDPQDIMVDEDGNVYVSDSQRIRKIDAKTGVISTLAGGYRYSSEGIAVEDDSLYSPQGIFKALSDDLYVASPFQNQVFKIDNTGLMSVVVGSGENGFNGDDGLAINASLELPFDVYVDKNNHIYIADATSHRIRKVDSKTGIITTIAGTGRTGDYNGSFSGDGELAIQANLNSPTGIQVTDQGDIYILDLGNNRIRKIDSKTGVIQTVVGNGTAPTEDLGNGSLATDAYLSYPRSFFVDKSENIYIADAETIRKVEAQTGIISQIYQIENSESLTGLTWKFGAIEGIWGDNTGDLFFSNTIDHRIQKLKLGSSENTASEPVLQADFSGDGKVDFSDFLMFAQAFGSSDSKFDIDGNGSVDFPDFLVFAQAFGK